jgi:hypothetical protein
VTTVRGGACSAPSRRHTVVELLVAPDLQKWPTLVHFRRHHMKTIAGDGILRAAAWLYVVPRVIVIGLLLGAAALATFLVLLQFARTWLIRFGA